ncbi:MAG: hypothetical protein ACK5KL_14135 [Dysgonomonas sp.]
MNISKYILLISLILLPVLGFAQKVGGKYIVTTGDTTQIVNSVSGLRSPDAKFLFKKSNAVSDSILANMTSDYTSLEEALMDVNDLISTVERDQTQLKTGNIGLGYRLSKINVDNMLKEKRAKAMADSILQVRHMQSVAEMARKYEEFGNKPTYFINGTNVEPEMINQLMSGDIVERNLKVQDTSSGNPNGEVWFIITDKAAQRLGLQVAKSASVSDYPEPARSSAAPSYKVEKEKSSNVRTGSKTSTKKSPAVDNKKAKKPRRSVRQIKADREARDNRDEEDDTPTYQPAPESVYTPQPTPKSQPTPAPQPRPARKAEEPKVSSQPQITQSPVSQPVENKQPEKKAEVQQATPITTNEVKTDSSAPKQERKTFVRARTVNNEEVKVSEPVDSAEEPLD